MAILNEQNIKKHEGRDDLAGEYKYGDMGQIILLILFIAVLLLDLILLNSFAWIRQAIPWYISLPVSIPFFAVALYLFKASHGEIFDKKRETLSVVNTGIYSRLRHPMYSATIMFLLGVVVLSLSIPALIVWLLFLFFYYMIARFEERLLVEMLGSEYEKYMQAVPMFIPRFRNR